MEETFETIAETVAETIGETVETVVPEVTEPLMEQLAPLYYAVVVNANLTVICICAVGICAGILAGLALWRWLR